MRTTVFFCIASNYWRHAAVAISSLVSNADHLDVHVFYESENPRWQKKINRLFKSSNSRLFYTSFDKSLAKNLKNCGHLGLSTYFRLFVPSLLNHCQKLIYLDSDLVVLGDINELNAISIDEFVLAAAPILSQNQTNYHQQRLGYSNNNGYFNAGVLVINVEKWLKDDILAKTLTFHENCPDRVLYADQDLLNYVLSADNQWKHLDYDWNMTVENFSDQNDDSLKIDNDTLSRLRDTPKIVHFNGQYKPWHFMYKHPFKSEYTRRRRSLQKRIYISDDFPGFLLKYLYQT